MTDKIFKPGDKVILIDSSRTRGAYQEGAKATVYQQVGDRLWVVFDGEELYEEVSGNVKRFRKMTKLDRALK